MSEIKSNQNPIFEISPDKFTYNLETDDITKLSSNTSKISKEIEVKIINKTNDYIAIKIKTTKTKNYIMSSNNIILSPKEEKKIKIRFKRDEDEKLELKSHRVLFEGIIIKEEEKDLNIKDLFDKYKNLIYEVKIKTHFSNNNGINKENNNDNNNNKLSDLIQASNKDIIIALVIALIIGLFFLN